ncbi:autotransporter-associated beta strand repeat-containing protein [Phragmitibacter flavus]|nr:autotransporter-associated beta strand repeat-containing protein [Phragmitibacter flavus]
MIPLQINRFTRFIPIFLGACLMMATSMRSYAFEWIGPSGVQAWNVDENWSFGVPGAIGGTTGDVAIFFEDNGPTSVTIDEDRWIGGIGFFTGAGAYTLGSEGANGGFALHMVDQSQIIMDAGVTQNLTIDAPLIIEPTSATDAGALSLINIAANGAVGPRMIVNGNISSGVTSQGATLALDSSVGTRNAVGGANLVSGVISDGGAAQGLTVTLRSISTNASGGATPSAERGAWNLTGLSTYTGDTVLESGALFFNTIGLAGQASAIGAGDTFRLGGGSIALYTGASATTDRAIISNGGTWFNNTGNSTVTITDAGSVTLTGSLTFRGSGSFSIDALITGSGSLSRTDGGTVFLNNVNNRFTGGISISTGTFEAASIATIAQAAIDGSAIGAGTTIALGQNQANVPVGRLRVSSATGGTTDRAITLNNGANSPATGSGGILESGVAGQTVTFSGTVKTASATVTHASYLGLTGVGNGVMSNIIGGTNADAAANVNLRLEKSGAGTWELQRANQYYRGTLVSAGTLLATNTTGSATGSGEITVNGTGILGGTGIVGGAAGSTITVGNTGTVMVGNTHNIATGMMSAAGYTAAESTFTLGSGADVDMNLQGTFQFDLFGYGDAGTTFGDADLLSFDTTGMITIGSAAVISMADVSGGSNWTTGTWQLVDWSGVDPSMVTGSFTFDLDTDSLAFGYGWDVSQFMTNGTISIIDIPTQTWIGSGVDQPTQSWANAANWENNNVPGPTDDVFFDSAGTVLGGQTRVITAIDENKSFRNLYFSGAQNYLINTGSGGVMYGYGTVLEVQGGNQSFGAQFRVANGVDNEFNIINNGTLNFSQPIMYHRLSGSVANKTLIFSGSGDTTVNHFQRRMNNYDLSIVKNGTGTLTLTGSTAIAAEANLAGAITGTMTVNDGILRINQEGNLGANPAAFNPGHLTINGGTVSAYADVTIDDENRGVTFGEEGATLRVENAAQTFAVNTPVTGAGGLVKTGPGTLSLGGANTYLGDTVVSSGVLLAVNELGSATGIGNVSVASGATLGGSGAISGGNSISVVSGSFLRVGTSHGSPGAAAEVLQLGLGGAANVAIQGTMQFDIRGAGSLLPLDDNYYDSANTSNDFLEIETLGSLSLSGGVVEVSVESTMDWVDGHIWKLIDWSNMMPSSVDTTGLTLATTVFDGFMLEQIIRNDGYYVMAIVPEPGRAVLLMVGAMVLVLRRKRD